MNPPGELLEGAESDHRSHALTWWCERRVEQDVADTGHVHHPVVVKVGRERHPVTLTKRIVEFYLYCTGALDIKYEKSEEERYIFQ